MTVNAARKILPSRFRNISDEEVQSLIVQLEILAEIFIETFEKSGSNRILGVIDSSLQKGQNGN